MADFAPAITATVKMNVDMTGSGYIAQAGDTVKGSKALSISGVKASANLSEAKAVFDAIVGNIAGGTFDTLSAKITSTRGVIV